MLGLDPAVRRDRRAERTPIAAATRRAHASRGIDEGAAAGTDPAGLGLFMVAAGLFATLLWYPGSSLAQAVPDGILRRALMGLAMGLTAIAIIYSP